MNTALPIIALVLSLVAYALGRKDAVKARPKLINLVGLFVFVALAAKFGTTDPKLTWPLAGGLLVGTLATTLAEALGVPTASLGLGVLGASLMPVFGKGVVTAEMGLAVGALAGSVFSVGIKHASFTAVSATAVAAIDAIGSFKSDIPAAAHFGSVIGLIALGAGLVTFALRIKPWLWPIASVLLGAGVYAAEKRMGVVGVGLPAALGALTGVVTVWMLPDEDDDAFKMAVATILWLGLATLAYGPGRGFGMGVALFVGIAIPIALGRSRPALSSAPLAALVLMRLFNQIHGRESAAIDISQHYVLIGLTVGAIMPAVYAQWRARATRLPAISSSLWIVLFVGIPVALTLLVEVKGLVGFIVGLGFGGLLLARNHSVTLQPLAITGGVSAATILVYARLIDVDSVTRAEKMHFVAYSAIAIAVLATPLALLVQSKQDEVAA